MIRIIVGEEVYKVPDGICCKDLRNHAGIVCPNMAYQLNKAQTDFTVPACHVFDKLLIEHPDTPVVYKCVACVTATARGAKI